MKSLLIFSSLLFCSQFLLAQDYETLKKAYNQSLEEEYAKSYAKAYQTLKAVCQENSYEANLRMGWLAYVNEKYDEAVKYYKTAAKLKPNSTESLWGLASPLTVLQKWEELNNTYLQIIKNDPKNSLANYYVGLYYYAEKNYAKANQYFSVSFELNPMDFEICRMSAWTFYFLKNKEKSIELFNRCLIMNQTNPSALEGIKLAKSL
ncbi:MAG: tetratricopeptide repeat protein [Flavobacteriia bacterium]|nr:tetratricopeptide repeat protein [Flavobacteriia bacterium]